MSTTLEHKRAVRRRFELRWAETYTGLQTAPWREVWAYDDTEARAVLDERCKEQGMPYGQIRATNEKPKKIGRKSA